MSTGFVFAAAESKYYSCCTCKEIYVEQAKQHKQLVNGRKSTKLHYYPPESRLEILAAGNLIFYFIIYNFKKIFKKTG